MLRHLVVFLYKTKQLKRGIGYISRTNYQIEKENYNSDKNNSLAESLIMTICQINFSYFN